VRLGTRRGRRAQRSHVQGAAELRSGNTSTRCSATLDAYCGRAPPSWGPPSGASPSVGTRTRGQTRTGLPVESPPAPRAIHSSPKPVAAPAVVSAATLIGYGAGSAGSAGMCVAVCNWESRRGREAWHPSERWSSPPSRVPAVTASYRGERTRSGPALEFNYPKECFATEKLFVLYHYSLLSLQA